MISVHCHRVVLLTAMICLGCGKAQTLPVDAETTEETAASKIPVLSPDEAYPIPNVDPEGLLNYVNQLAARDPVGETDEERQADLKSRTKSRLIAADRILLSEDIDAGLLEAGVIAKLDALRTLANIDPQGLGDYFQPFVESMIEGDDARLSLVARVSRFQAEIDRLANGRTDDPEPVIGQLREILADPHAGYAEFLATQYVGVVLNARGFSEQATAALNMVGNHFAEAKDEKLAAEAKSLLGKTAFRQQVVAAMGGKPADLEMLTASVGDLLSDSSKLDVEALDTTLNAGQMLEYTGSFAAAREVFKSIGTAFADQEETSLQQQATRSVERALKRLDLVGKPVAIEGVHVDGTPFDWEKLSGKVVLIDFWATWSKPWEDALPQLKNTYQQFHEDGFEIVGVNLDDNRNAMYSYLRSRQIPWPLIIDETGGGLANSNAIKYGVEAVPFVVLVGRNGKVANIHVRGAELDQQVQELLASPSSQGAQEDNGKTTRR